MNSLKKIFLIEDDTDDQELFVDALNMLSNVKLIGIAKNGKEALDILQNSLLLPDIIFLDFNMPVMNGIECLNAIIKNPKTQTIPVVMLSSAFEKAEVARKFGAKEFIKKTVDINIFRTQIKKAINPSVALSY